VFSGFLDAVLTGVSDFHLRGGFWESAAQGSRFIPGHPLINRWRTGGNLSVINTGRKPDKVDLTP